MASSDVVKVILSFYRDVEGSAFERHRGRVPFDIEKHNAGFLNTASLISISSAIIWKHTSAIACDPAIVIAGDRRRSQKIEPCSIFCDRLRSSAIICDRLRS